jgi:membrane-associated phospholipid phosphatase
MSPNIHARNNIVWNPANSIRIHNRNNIVWNPANSIHNRNNIVWYPARLAPAYLPILASIYYLLNIQNVNYFTFVIMIFVSNIINTFLKNIIFKPIYSITNRTNLPIIGRGMRPEGATSCAVTLNNKPAHSFGMPSGHSQIVWLIAAYIILNYTYGKSLSDIKSGEWIIMVSLVLFAIYTSYSRVYVEGCHTIQQVIIGGLIGILIASIFFFTRGYITQAYTNLTPDTKFAVGISILCLSVIIGFIMLFVG